MDSIPWISAQAAINGGFFVPRLLARHGRLARMIVPLWCPPGALGTALLRKAYWNAPNFYHPELKDAPVSTMLAAKLRFEAGGLFCREPRASWKFIDRSNRAYERALIDRLRSPELAAVMRGRPGIFISWSDISLAAIRLFHAAGWKTVTMQLNCGRLEEEIVAAECARYPAMAEKHYRAPDGFHERTVQEYLETDHVISNSAWGREYLVSNGVPAEKISLVPFAYEGAPGRGVRREYPAAFTHERPMRVLHVGQMSLRKGLGRLLEAVGALRGHPVEFTFAGSVGVPIPPEVATNPRVRILGVVSREKIESLYRESDVFVFPTLSDAFGLTQLECMAWRLPLIASRHCGTVVRDGQNGLLLQELTPSSIAAALLRCLGSPASLALWSSACAVPAQCSMDSFAGSLQEIERRLYPVSA